MAIDRSTELLIDRVRAWIDDARRVVVLTGAGISTDSGIPDFRGPQGLWTKNPAAEKMATIQHYVADPDVRKAAWRSRREHPAWRSEPNPGHLALVEATWVLSAVYELDAAGIATALEMLLNHKTLTVQDSEVVSAALGHFLKHPSLGFSDCMQLEIARKAGHLPFGSFDRRLARLPDVERL